MHKNLNSDFSLPWENMNKFCVFHLKDKLNLKTKVILKSWPEFFYFINIKCIYIFLDFECTKKKKTWTKKGEVRWGKGERQRGKGKGRGGATGEEQGREGKGEGEVHRSVTLKGACTILGLRLQEDIKKNH